MPMQPPPSVLPIEATWREIASPFSGVGVRLPQLLGGAPAPTEVEVLRQQLGLDNAERWLYLTYDCWAGNIDYVYGLGARQGVPFGPMEEDDLEKVDAVYTKLMAEFGMTAADAYSFKPFVRGYWGCA